MGGMRVGKKKKTGSEEMVVKQWGGWEMRGNGRFNEIPFGRCE